MKRALHRVALSLYLLAGGCLDSLVSAECTDELTECSGACVALDSDPDNCGGCGITCEGACMQGECRGGAATGGGMPGGADAGPAADTDGGSGGAPDGGEGDDADAADPACAAPLQPCTGGCIDERSDPLNCGACGHACASGICVNGACQDDVAGHIVVIGHDFTESHGALARLLGNAVFLAPASPARVVTFAGDADPAAMTRIRQAVDAVADLTGRSWQEVPADTSAMVPPLLTTCDVFLLPSQTHAEPAVLNALGAAWHDALANFVAAGGIIIVLDGGGFNGGTHQVLEAAGLFHAASATPVTGLIVDLTAPADALVTSIPMHYLAPARSVGFPEATGSAVAHAGDHPVVIHQAVY